MSNVRMVWYVLMLSITCVAQEIKWESLKIDNNIEVFFPEKFTKMQQGSDVMYECKLANGTAKLSFGIKDFSASGLTVQQMNAETSTDKFWADLVPAFINQAPDTKLVENEKISFKNYNAAAVVATKGKNTIYITIVIKDLKCYILQFTSLEGKGDEKLKDEFFENIIM